VAYFFFFLAFALAAFFFAIRVFSFRTILPWRCAYGRIARMNNFYSHARDVKKKLSTNENKFRRVRSDTSWGRKKITVARDQLQPAAPHAHLDIVEFA
jgi:hypothetical protein